MPAIVVGSGATDRNTAWSEAYTIIDKGNPANDTGILTSFEVWANQAITGFKMGTFSGSGTSYDDRDYETIGSVSAGSKQTFSGLHCDVVSGDFIGCYYAAGKVEAQSSQPSGSAYYVGGDKFGTGSNTYSPDTNVISLHATGTSPYDETARLQVILAAQGITTAIFRSETARLQVVLAAQGISAIQAMVDTAKLQVVLAAQGESDSSPCLELAKEQIILAAQGITTAIFRSETARLQVVLATQGEADIQTMVDLAKLQVVLATQGISTAMLMPELAKLQVILTAQGIAAILTIVDTAKLQVILAAQGEADSFYMGELGKLQVILAQIGISTVWNLGKVRLQGAVRNLASVRELEAL